jgi:phospholipase/carboxylesterase
VSPRGPIALDHGGFAWAPLTVPGNPDPDDVAHGTATLWEWIDATIPATSPLIVIGFSQGGLMASQLLRTRPERIAATAMLAGFVLGVELPGDAALEITRPPVLYCRGLNDTVISPDAVTRTEAWLSSHTSATVHTYPGLGHSIDQRVLADLIDFLN